jgi:hypothetical protein
VGITAPQIMLVLGAAAMVTGLVCDARAGGFDRLASLCLAASGDFVGTLRLDWRQLPLTHLGMIAGGLTTVPPLRALRPGCRRQFCARLVQNLACSAWMVVGMTAGTGSSCAWRRGLAGAMRLRCWVVCSAAWRGAWWQASRSIACGTR